jgi:hypothetical protein
MRPIENSTTRRAFFKNAAFGAAGIGIMGSLAAVGQEPKGGKPPAGQGLRSGVLPDDTDT